MAELSPEEISSMFEQESDDSGKPVEVYDFNKSSPIPQEQKKTVALIHESYAQSASLTISSFLRFDVEMKLGDVEQLTFSEYVSSLVNPTCITTFDMQPLNGYGLVEVNSAIMYTFVNRMLGGGVEVPSMSRPFTGIELSVVKQFVKMLLKELEMAWNTIIRISFNVKETKTNPAFVRIIPTRELCLVTTIKVKVGETSGLITICMPYSNFEPIASKLGSQQWQKYTIKQSDEVQAAHRKNFGRVELDLQAVLGGVELSMVELLALRPGDILSLDQRTRNPIMLRVGGDNKFEVNPGLVGRYKGVIVQNELFKV